MTFEIEYEADTKLDIDYTKYATMVGQKVLESESFPYSAEINLVITSLEEIQKVNQEFRDINAPTDVLSFPMIPFETPADYTLIEEDKEDYLDLDTGDVMLGDIMICAERVISQAKDYGHSQEREFSFLIAHSFLHLLGYDHMTEEEAQIMEKKQKEVLESLAIHR